MRNVILSLLISIFLVSCVNWQSRGSLAISMSDVAVSEDSETKALSSLRTKWSIDLTRSGFSFFKELSVSETSIEIAGLSPGKYYDLIIRTYDDEGILLNYGSDEIFIQRGENTADIFLSGVLQNFYFIEDGVKSAAEIVEVDPYYFELNIELEPESNTRQLIPYCGHTGEQLLMVSPDGTETRFTSGTDALDFSLYPVHINVLTPDAQVVEYLVTINHSPSFSLDLEIDDFSEVSGELAVISGKTENDIYPKGVVFSVEAPTGWNEYFWLLNQEPNLPPEGENSQVFTLDTSSLSYRDYELSCLFGTDEKYYSATYRFSVEVT